MSRVGTCNLDGPGCASTPRGRSARRSRRLRQGLLATLAAAVALACASAQASGATVTRTFSAERSESSFVVPAGVESISVVAVGGAGGETLEDEGGLGGRVEAGLGVTPGQTLYVEVGYGGGVLTQRDGGGASDVRTAPRAAGLSPDDRLIVAGAGGGAGEEALSGGEAHRGGNGGNAGEASGEEGGTGIFAEGGRGGTQTSGGAAGGFFGEGGCAKYEKPEAGGLGTGGEGALCRSDGNLEGGQGGAGYYGGGGGAATFSGGGGGGGSSLVPAGGSFRLAEGEAPEVQISYTQPPNAPAVVTEPASAISSEAATLNATVNPEDENVTSCSFEYGTSEGYGADTPCAPSPGSGIAPVEVSAHIGGLSAATTYHYRIVATNGQGTSYGHDGTFSTTAHEPPQVSAVSPEVGASAGGQTVTITGTELEEATAVKFGTTPAASFIVDSSESITAVTPAGSGTVGVYVTTPSGTSSGSVRFAFLTPVVTSMAPSVGPAEGGTPVQIRGTGFDAASTVSFGGNAATSVTYESSTELRAVAPAGTETVYVTVTTPYAGTSADVPNGRFGYESGAPEYGSCQSAPALVAEFTDRDCRVFTFAGGKGKYRWDPGAVSNRFTAASNGSVTLEGTSKRKVTCTRAAIAGTISSTGVSGETIRFFGCTSVGEPCTGSGLATGEITTSTLQGRLAWESKARNEVVLALTPVAQPFMQYTCGAGAATTVTGSILEPVKAAKMETTSKVKLKASKGKQTPESLEGGERHVLSSSTGGGPAEQTGLTLTATQTNEEALEVNPSK